MYEIQQQIVETLKKLQQKLFNDVRYQNLFYVDESASISDNSNSQKFKCMDISPEDNLTVTCEERKNWGGCEKDWMMESFYCARTCGYCTFDASPQNYNYDNNDPQIKENNYEDQTPTPTKSPTKNQDKIQADFQKNQNQQKNNVDDTCMDTIPQDNVTATCQERKDWGGCKKEWMQQGNYCAKTCGFCGSQQTSSEQDEISWVDQEQGVSEVSKDETVGTLSLVQQLKAAAFDGTNDEGTAEMKKSKGVDI
eukprot:TRINITY_DN18173_c0_g7_i1.p1 TRINITY_DN18173_c0_g7~~TRINITY_DN18173_c0_g7_i1.p1  ORF type:complete len:291 (-),score=67.72 TRINITY_DN18173_c0_g7_i1:201-956(-)